MASNSVTAKRTIADFTCEGKVAVVTGGARGLGYAFCEALAESGASVAILDIGQPSDEALEKLRSFGVKAEFYKTNVCDEEQVAKVVDQVVKEFGYVDINVNAAGIVKDEPFLETSISNIRRTLDVNTIGAYLVAQSCARVMSKQGRGGSIIFVATLTSYQATPVQNISIYAASKAALRGLIKPMAMELAPHGIRVNSISPGYMMTDMTKMLGEQNPELIKAFSKESMFGRMGKPEELRGVLIFLASGASSYMTGQDVLVDGGVSSW
ncbi:NAD(P)-binding protein [Coniochaeta ligniaria NRRL 30616]|uniref:NAD(P)-binding protein n=1 Tax=Coniochaeta ligniaria NRRL 30616 TaxID=1408157 RepID=A0A1J7IZK9_9PEZI|nr:NAD(P)-binding protein [Coniochaeta ligniaria NRRL 30616]